MPATVGMSGTDGALFQEVIRQVDASKVNFVCWLDRPYSLALGGYQDTILKLSRHGSEEQGNPEFIKQAAELMGGLEKYPTGEDLHEMKWRTLVADSHLDYKKLSGHHRAVLNGLRDGLETIYDESSGLSREEWDALIQYYAALLRIEFAPSWRFCVTEGGYVGLVPVDARIGDMAYVIYGCVVPFLFRKSEEREGAFCLVGDCYLHGIMYGEALSSGTFKEEKIRIY